MQHIRSFVRSVVEESERVVCPADAVFFLTWREKIGQHSLANFRPACVEDTGL